MNITKYFKKTWPKNIEYIVHWKTNNLVESQNAVLRRFFKSKNRSLLEFVNEIRDFFTSQILIIRNSILGKGKYNLIKKYQTPKRRLRLLRALCRLGMPTNDWVDRDLVLLQEQVAKRGEMAPTERRSMSLRPSRLNNEAKFQSNGLKYLKDQPESDEVKKHIIRYCFSQIKNVVEMRHSATNFLFQFAVYPERDLNNSSPTPFLVKYDCSNRKKLDFFCSCKNKRGCYHLLVISILFQLPRTIFKKKTFSLPSWKLRINC